MNIPFPLSSGKSRQAKLFSTMGTAIAALLILVGLPTSSYAQAAGQTITQVAFTMPTELESVLKGLHGGAQDLVGLPVASPKASAFADKVSAHLRKKGYPFCHRPGYLRSRQPRSSYRWGKSWQDRRRQCRRKRLAVQRRHLEVNSLGLRARSFITANSNPPPPPLIATAL